MAALPGEYDDGGEEEFTLPLPREDRLWRHPSELTDGDFTLRLDPTMVRNRWLSSQPSRASAWTAGLVGALLASGLVVLGTHLATALTGAPAHPAAITLTSTADAPSATTASSGPELAGLGPSLVAGVERVGAAVVTIDVASGGSDLRLLGLILNKNGTVLTAAAPLDGATSVLVTLPGNEVVPAVAIYPDAASGLAVLQVNGVDNLPTAILAPQPVATANFTVAVTAAGGTRYAVGMVRQLDTAPQFPTGPLVDALMTDLPTASTPPGSPVLDAGGRVIGLVAGESGGSTAVVPSWLALPVSEQLMLSGEVQHGWLGISGENAKASSAGALVTTVTKRGAGAEAGIKSGDVITALDGTPVRSFAALQGRLYTLPPGTTVTLGISRGATHLTRHLHLDDRTAA
ncbi:MAG TPA: PDZ domain-containing protein [Acidimicrobiales bacterium]|nr:PDZ domain-containing protein [Acidimicrobiales bacterium]